MKTDIHEYLRELRIEQRLSIQALAELSGVSASHISRIERKKRNPSCDTLEKLAPHLQVEYEKLLEVADLLGKLKNNLDLDNILTPKYVMYKGKLLNDDIKKQIRELLKSYEDEQ